MNPFNLSPAASAFWGSIVRHLLTLIAGMLVTHGYVSQTGANAYIEELVGVALYAGGNVWANRVTYWQQIKHLVARAMPAGTTDTAVNAKVVELKAAGALPSVFTPPDVVPSLVKP
jgi:hypothetical protein